MIARILAELIPPSLELMMREVSPQHILATLSLLQLVSMSMLSERVLSKSASYSIEYQLLVLFSLWSFACLSILLWLFGWIVLQACGAR